MLVPLRLRVHMQEKLDILSLLCKSHLFPSSASYCSYGGSRSIFNRSSDYTVLIITSKLLTVRVLPLLSCISHFLIMPNTSLMLIYVSLSNRQAIMYTTFRCHHLLHKNLCYSSRSCSRDVVDPEQELETT